MKPKLILWLALVAILCGCARPSRYSGEFDGVARTAAFRSSVGDEEVGLLFSVHSVRDIKEIGHGQIPRPLTNITAILINRSVRLFPSENVTVNQELRVRGILDSMPVKGRTRNSYTRPIGTPPQAFQPTLRVKKIYSKELP